MADGILYSSNGSAVIEVGANNTSARITNSLTLNNDKQLRFNTVNTSASAYFVQQNDDNFVLYTTNTAYGQRPVWSIFANSITSAFDIAVPLKINGALTSNGTTGTAGQVLTSNGTATYWSSVGGTGTVTSVATGNGMTGGPVTTTGTVSVLANTGIVANSTGLFVNSTYIGTLTANNTSFVGSVSAANVVSNSQLSSNLANYQTTAGLSANVATLTANNASFLGGVAAAAYVQNTESRTLSGNLTFSGANVNFTGNVRITGGLIANGSLGTAADVLTSNGSSVYWTPAAGGGSSNAVYVKGGAAAIGTLAAGGSNLFRVNGNTLNYNTTFVAGENGSATGPITVAPGITLTVETGARVAIL